MINAERIAEMKRLSAEASEGKWEIDRSSDDNDFVTDIWVDGEDSGHIEIHGDTVASSINNAQFIAKSRQFVPDIIVAYESKCEQVGVLVDGLNKAVDEIVKLREALEGVRLYCEITKRNGVEMSDIEHIDNQAKDALK